MDTVKAMPAAHWADLIPPTGMEESSPKLHISTSEELVLNGPDILTSGPHSATFQEMKPWDRLKRTWKRDEEIQFDEDKFNLLVSFFNTHSTNFISNKVI